MDKIELINEAGNIEEFRIIDTFGMDDNDYAVLMPINEVNTMTYILRIEYSPSGDLILTGIEDDEEFNDAIAIYEELKKEKLQ
ncbi:MAG: DUF1292 domain-containing protein [Tissierellia bacterium]|nr:DUF1292 domain-containing protein [Tissierellia bacterium]